MPEEEKAEKQKIKKKAGTKIQNLYDTSSGLKRKNKSCPKCGKGVFMAQHKDRATCGKCGYCEILSKSEEKPAKESKEKPKK